MCGVLITWCIGRNNNGPIGSENQVRGGNVNTRVVKLLPVDVKKNGKTNEEQQKGLAKDERVVAPEQEVNSLGDDSKKQIDGQGADTTTTKYCPIH